MFIEICLGILTAASLVLIFVLLRIAMKAQDSIRLLQTDIHILSKDMVHLVNTMDQFVQDDLRNFSQETCQLISNLNELSSDVNHKVHSLNALFKPLGSLSSKLDEETSSSESSSKRATIPHILNWIASTALLFKTTREFIKNYEKRS